MNNCHRPVVKREPIRLLLDDILQRKMVEVAFFAMVKIEDIKLLEA